MTSPGLDGSGEVICRYCNGRPGGCMKCVSRPGLDGSGDLPDRAAEQVAEQFHVTYERLAPAFGYKTRGASAVPWADVPEANKRLMVAVCADLLDRGVIS